MPDRRPPQAKKRLLVMMGDGGYANEMRQIVDQLDGRFELSFAAIEGVGDWIHGHAPDSVYIVDSVVTRTPQSVPARLWTIARGVARMIGIIRKTKPDAVLSLGHPNAVPACLAARLLGVRAVFVESMTRILSLSQTGTILYRLHLCSRFYVQWQALAAAYPKAVYKGTVFDLRDSRHDAL